MSAAAGMGRRPNGGCACRDRRYPRGDGPPSRDEHRRGVALVLRIAGRRARRARTVNDGLAALEEALQWVRRNDERLYEAEVHRIKGELLLTQDVPTRSRPKTVSNKRWPLRVTKRPSRSNCGPR